jgi:putative tryptophan/tyrosine transport system substrate-binding protein
MDRRAFLATLGVLAARPAAEAQQPGKVYRVGLMIGDVPARVEAFRAGLSALGWTEGQNIVLELRGSGGRFESHARMAADLVRLPVDVIVAGGSESVQAAREASASIPIVMTLVGDPVDRGFIASFTRPGGSITGLANLSVELDAKRLELLKELVPGLRRVAVLWNPPQPAHKTALARLDSAAKVLGIRLLPVAVNADKDLDPAFEAVRRERAAGVTMLGSTVHFANLERIAQSGIRAKVPVVSWTSTFTSAGGLLAYGPDENDLTRRAASYVDRILKGAKPADLPVEQPTKFELVINLKTAKALGLTIPPSLLQRADQVIE